MNVKGFKMFSFQYSSDLFTVIVLNEFLLEVLKKKIRLFLFFYRAFPSFKVKLIYKCFE